MKNPIKIAIAVSTFPPYRGGMGNVAEMHARLLAAAGHDVTVFAPSVENREGPYRVRQVRAKVRWGNAAWVPALWSLTGDFDIVFLHYPFFGGIESFTLRKRSRPALVVYYHMDAIGLGLLGRIFALHRKIFLPRLLRNADRVLASTESYYASSFASRFLPSSDPKCGAVPIAVDCVRFSPGEETTEARVLFVGSLDRAHYFKGIAILLEAWRMVLRELPAAQLAIVGEGDMRAEYEARAKDAGLAARVQFLGNVSSEALPLQYRQSSLVVLPSVDRSEAFGLVVLEAMASGKAVIASRLPGVSSVVRDQETGLLVPPNDPAALAKAIVHMLVNPSLCRGYGERGRAVAVSEYSEAAIGEKLNAIVDQV